MGRPLEGPKLRGLTYEARLHIPLHLRPLVGGRTKLKRSLKTRDKGEAMRRYGAAMAAMQRELQELLDGGELRKRVELFREPALVPDGPDLTSVEKAELLLGVRDLDPDNSVHNEVFNSISTGQPMPITWDEAISVWKRERNRANARPLAKSTIYCTTKAVNSFRPYASPTQITKQTIRKWIEDQEQVLSPSTVAANFRLISSVVQTLIDTDQLDGTNVFKSIRYTARQDADQQRRAFTDQELVVLKTEVSPIYLMCLTGLRPGEYASRRASDIDGNILVINDEESIGWRTKTLSSGRRVPLPPGFEFDTSNRKQGSRIGRYNKDLRKHISDKLATAHSGRHTFYELSRRAGCDQRVIETICGHGEVTGSRSANKYGSMPDDVLIRESTKVWELVNGLIA